MNKFHQLNPENRNKNVQQFTSLAAESPQAHIFENRRRSSPFFSRSFENDCHTLIIEVSSFLGQHPRNDVFPYLVNSMETQWRIQGRGPGGPPPLFLDQTEARRAENCFWRPPPPLSKGLDDRTPTLSQGLDLAWHWKHEHSVAYIRHVSALWKHAYLLFDVRDTFPFRHVSIPETNDQVSVTFLLLHFRSFFFKSFHGLAPNSSYNLRGKDSLSIPRLQSTKYGLHSFRYSASKCWNMLPEVLRTADH